MKHLFSILSFGLLLASAPFATAQSLDAQAAYAHGIAAAQKKDFGHRPYNALKQYELPIEDFDQVLRMDPDFSRAYNELAWPLATAEKPSVCAACGRSSCLREHAK